MRHYDIPPSAKQHLHIKVFVPVGVQSLLDHTGGVCLLGIDGDDCERVREAKHITFREPIGSDNYAQDISRMSSV